MAESEKSDEGKQETEAADPSVAQPVTPPPQKPPAADDTGSASGDIKPPQPILVRLVGGDDLEPFEEETLAISRETLAISRRTYWIAIFGFLAALAAACFVGVQVSEMTDQTQILSSQTESAAAGATISEMNTRKQLQIAEQQAKSAQDAVRLASGESTRNAVRVERQLKLLQDQAQATRDQANAALQSALAIQKQTDISQRPWLSVQVAPNSDLAFVGGQAALAFKLSIKNVGKSIAKDIWISMKFVPTAPSFPPVALDSRKHQGEVCDPPRPTPTTFDLFPTDSPTEQIMSVSTNKSDLDAAAVSHPTDVSRRFVGLYIVGCANYRSSFGTQIHQTFFGFHLGGPTIRGPNGEELLILPNGIPSVGGFEVGVPVPNKQIWMMRELFSRNDAT